MQVTLSPSMVDYHVRQLKTLKNLKGPGFNYAINRTYEILSKHWDELVKPLQPNAKIKELFEKNKAIELKEHVIIDADLMKASKIKDFDDVDLEKVQKEVDKLAKKYKVELDTRKEMFEDFNKVYQDKSEEIKVYGIDMQKSGVPEALGEIDKEISDKFHFMVFDSEFDD